MVGKSFPLSHRRRSFDVEELKKTGGRQLSGTIGNDLGFWTTCFLGFQTLGAIYGIHSLTVQSDNKIRRYWDKSSLRVYWARSLKRHLTNCIVFFKTTLHLHLKIALVLLVVLSGLSLW